MIYKNHKIEAEVSEYITLALKDDGTPDPKKITSQDGWDVTGYYIQNQDNPDDEDWLNGKSLDQVKAIIDKKVG